jgi:hypothetical protein
MSLALRHLHWLTVPYQQLMQKFAENTKKSKKEGIAKTLQGIVVMFNSGVIYCDM